MKKMPFLFKFHAGLNKYDKLKHTKNISVSHSLPPPLSGSWGAGAYSRCHMARGGAHPEQVRQPFVLTFTPAFTPIGNFPINLLPLSACLWTASGPERI